MKRPVIVTVLACSLLVNSVIADDILCWFPPGTEAAKCKTITDSLSSNSKLVITPRVAKNYPELLAAFSEKKPQLAYAGSFVSSILQARNLSVPLVQAVDGREMYGGVMIYAKGQNPADILKNSPVEIAFTEGASSGESCAKAATEGKASIKVNKHGAAADAVKTGKAKAAFVKDTWWEDNKAKYPDFESYSVPGISDSKNPDNILQSSTGVSDEMRKKIADAAIAGKDAFGAQKMEVFERSKLDFSMQLMAKGKIDPKTYSWQ